MLEDSISSSETTRDYPALSPFWLLSHKLFPKKSIVSQYTNHLFSPFTEQNVVRNSAGIIHKGVPQLLQAFFSYTHPEMSVSYYREDVTETAASLIMAFEIQL